MGKAHDKIGWLFDLGAASALSGATGFAFYRLGPLDHSPLGAAAAASVAFLAAHALLSHIGGARPKLPLSVFAVPEIELQPEPEALLLDDILAGTAPDSRVVRLFTTDQRPMSGRSKDGFDGHNGTVQDSDAADALHQALAEIRRALR